MIIDESVYTLGQSPVKTGARYQPNSNVPRTPIKSVQDICGRALSILGAMTNRCQRQGNSKEQILHKSWTDLGC